MQDISPWSVPTVSPQSWIRGLGIGIMVVGMCLLISVGFRHIQSPDPYTQAVLQLPGQASHGASLFALNCAACHGEEGNGRVGPSLRNLKSRRSDRFIIEQVTSGNTPPMPQFQPDPQEMSDLIAYLKGL